MFFVCSSIGNEEFVGEELDIIISIDAANDETDQIFWCITHQLSVQPLNIEKGTDEERVGSVEVDTEEIVMRKVGVAEELGKMVVEPGSVLFASSENGERIGEMEAAFDGGMQVEG